MLRTPFLISLSFCLAFSIFVVQIAGALEKQYHAISNSGNIYKLSIESETSEVMKPLLVTITVSDQDGIPVSGVKLSCSLTMPAMAMPNNKPPIKESGEIGQHKGVFLLTMAGLWHVNLSAVYSSGEQESVIISIPGVSSGQSDDNNIDAKLEALFQKQGDTEKK